MRGRKKPDPAEAARERLIRQERQARAAAHARAVADGVAETVALSRARGQAVAEPPKRRSRTVLQPYRRQTGLEWLAAKGRIDAAARSAGEHYGVVYRRAKAEQPIPSTLEVTPGCGPGFTPDLQAVLKHGEGTQVARRKLAEFRRRLWRQADLVAACDLVCGEEKTPREAAGGDRDGARLEAVLKVALDILAAPTG
ncbi:hypothetical protein [uncultured Phenylobacterium sp.]|uniref:hypothetical protein n=1 Tax=uncultured Phenylobacterium sp. TaxID=349273 RepID=UPI0025F25400|nr:hypothetical protein [uncultured Phenylobacterium sp.]